MNFLEKQKVMRQIQEVNPGLIGLLSEEEINDIFEALKNGEKIENLVGTAEKATLRASASIEEQEAQRKKEEEAKKKEEAAKKKAEVTSEEAPDPTKEPATETSPVTPEPEVSEEATKEEDGDASESEAAPAPEPEASAEESTNE